MPRYHVLLAREKSGQPWCIEFGAYDRADVVAERLSYREQGYRPSNLKIIASNSAVQSCVNYCVAAFNG